MTDKRIAIIIDADGKAGVAAFDANTRGAVALGEAMDDLTSKSRRSGEQAEKTGKKWEYTGKMIGLAISTAVSGFAVLVGHEIKVADEAGKLAAKLGVSTEFISEMGYAAKATGADAAILESGLFGLTDAAVKAEAGVKRPAAAFKALGVDVTDTHGKLKSLEDLLPELANKFERMQDGPKKAALATLLFGSAARDLLPLLNEGAQGIEDLRRRAHALGLTVTDETAAAAAALNDELDLTKARVAGAAQQIGVGLTPAVTRLAERLNVAANDVEGLRSAGEGLGTVLDTLIRLAERVGLTFQHMGVDAAAALEAASAAWDIAIQISSFGAADGSLGDAWNRLIRAGEVQDQEHARIEASAASAARLADAQARLAETERNLKYVQYDGPLLKGVDKPVDPDTTRVFNPAGNPDRDAERQAESIRKYRKEAELLAAELQGPAQEALIKHKQRIRELEADYKAGNITLQDRNTLMKVADAQRDETLRGLAEEADVLGRLQAEMEDEVRLSGLSADARRVEEAVLRAVADAHRVALEQKNADLELTPKEIEATRAYIAAKQEEIKANEALVRAAEDYRDAWVNAAADGARAWGDWLADGFDDTKDFADGVKSIFKRLVSDLATTFLQQRFVQPFQEMLTNMMGLGSTSGGSVGAGQQGSILSGFGSIINTGFDKLLSGIGSLFGFGGTATTSIAQGVGQMLPEAVKAGALAAQQAGVGGGGLASGAVGGFAKAIPVIGWIYAGMQLAGNLYDKGWDINGQRNDVARGTLATGDLVLAINAGMTNVLDRTLRSIGLSDKWASMLSGSSLLAAVFGRKKPEITGQGITGSYGFDGFDGQSYADIKQKGGWFHSDKKWPEYAALDSAIDAAFDAAAGTVNKAAQQLAEQAGLDISSQLANVKISLGKLQLSADPEEAQKQLEAAIDQVVQNLANRAVQSLGFGSLLDDGYAATDIMSALSATIALVTRNTGELDRALTGLEVAKIKAGVEYFERMAQIDGAALGDEIARLVGVINDYGDLIGGVRSDIDTHDLNEYQRAQVDVELQYRSLVEQANELAKALGLSGARAEDLATIEQWRALQMADLAEQYESMLDKERAAFLGNLGLSDLSPLRDDEKLTEAMQLLQDAAAAGDWDSAQNYAQQALGLGRDLYASGDDYNALYAQVLDILNSITATDTQGLQLEQLTSIVDLLRSNPSDIASALFDLLIGPVTEPDTTSGGTGGNSNGNSGSSAGSSGGSGGGYGPPACVAADMLLDDGTTADMASAGDVHGTHDPVEGFARHGIRVRGEAVLQPCVRLVTESGAALVCSRSTPFTAVDAPADLPEYTTRAPDMQGRQVYVRRRSPVDARCYVLHEETVVRVEDAGDRYVVPLDFGGRSFAAGEASDALIYSHNVQKAPDHLLMSMASSLASIDATNSMMAQAEQDRALAEIGGSTRTGR